MVRPGGGNTMVGPQPGMMSGMQQSSVNAGAAAGGVYPDVDMSHLSEEERMLIESVMAKAQMEELDARPSPGGGISAMSSVRLVYDSYSYNFHTR